MNKYIVELIKENPLSSFLIGLALAVFAVNDFSGALIYGAAVAAVVLLASLLSVLLRPVIPESLNTVVYFLILVTLTITVQLLMNAFILAWYNLVSAGLISIPLIGLLINDAGPMDDSITKKEAASKSIKGAAGFFLIVLVVSILRQVLGAGMLTLIDPINGTELFALQVLPAAYSINLFSQVYGGLFILACVGALLSKMQSKEEVI